MRPFQQILEQFLSLYWRGSCGKTRPITSAAISRQRELAHQQQTPCLAVAIYILHTVVHLAIFITENAQFQYLGQQAFCRFVRILRLGANQHEQALPDGSDRTAVDSHTSFPHTLQHGLHECSAPSKNCRASTASRNMDNPSIPQKTWSAPCSDVSGISTKLGTLNTPCACAA